MKWILLLLHGGGGRIFWRDCPDPTGLGCLPERPKRARDQGHIEDTNLSLYGLFLLFLGNSPQLSSRLISC